MKNILRPFYKYWPVAIVLVIIAGWPEINDWQWNSAKEEARTLIAKYETERDTQDKLLVAAQTAAVVPAAAAANAAAEPGASASATAAASTASAPVTPAVAPAPTPAALAVPAAPAHVITVEMSALTCMAANSFYTPYWQLGSPYRVKLIQAFIWHGYGVEIPKTQAVGERGCGQAEDGKYVFLGH